MTRLRTRLPRHWPAALLALGVLLAALLGGSLGYFLRFDLPDVRALEDYSPPVMSRVLDAGGEEVATFAEQRRILVRFHDIPVEFQQALIATEDSNFYSHTGIDFKGVVRAAWSDLRHLRLAQGASTLTQQLARNLFLHPEKTIRRKVQEALLAIEIERQYTKQEILAFYCNQIYMGHGRYGLEAASRHYFGKPTRALSLVESAMLAGLIQRPEALSPFKNPERALARRNYVLRRMVEEGMLGAEEAAAAAELPLEPVAGRGSDNVAPYFVEDVRRWLQDHYGSSSLYKEGFEVRTTLDPRLQLAANDALERGLRELDKRQGWRDELKRVPDDGDPATWEAPGWNRPMAEGDVVDGVVLEVDERRALVRIGPWRGALDAEAIGWTGKRSPAKLLRVGDVARVRLSAIDEENGSVELSLEQEPLVEAALVALEPSTGAIRALVGGFDFERSEFNRAVQSLRQTGSAFKPIVYAAALDRGMTLADRILDEPTVFLDRRNPVPYQPENYSNKYYETITLRTALEKSANIATVKLLDRIGYDAVIDTARRLGISSDLQPYPSLALGAFGISLLEITSAYGAFANQGVLVEPYWVDEVRSRDGALLQTLEPEVHDAVSPQLAHLMNRVLSGVITDGTGRTAASLGLTLAGKTGTTDQNTDAWFIGYAPNLAVGVWVGFDEPRSLGSRETGALAALPIWRGFMEQALPPGSTPDFEMPNGLTIVAIDRHTGLKANRRADCRDVISEVFVEGTEPTAYCTREEHARLALPYPFQRYALNDQGALRIPRDRLDPLLRHEVDTFLVDGGARLEAYTEHGTVSLPLEALPPDDAAERLPGWLLERYDVEGWVGLDGRAAALVWMR